MTNDATKTFGDWAADAAGHHAAGRLDAAAAAYRAALALSPGHAAIMHNLATIVATMGRLHDAVALFDQVIEANPRHAAAHYNRATALHSMGDMVGAIANYSTTTMLEPAHYDAHRNLAFLHLAAGDRGRALDHFARTNEIRRGDDQATLSNRSLTHATTDKLRHDSDQFRYLAGRHRDARRFDMLARSYSGLADDLGDLVGAAASPLTASQRTMIGEDYNTAINIFGAAEMNGPVLGSTFDADRIASDLDSSGAAVIDDLLSPPAFDRFRRFLLESTVWHDFSHIGGFVASYLEDGLASPLLLQVVDELRDGLPTLLADKPLVQAWAFKGLVAQSKVDLHADDAALSLNFWMTPDTANRNPATGGLIIYRDPPPSDWRITGYDADRARIEAFAERCRESALTIPYRANRAVLFASRLVHVSHQPDFEAGYENSRINVTLLFGRATD